jgi:hypothetical protein
MTASALTLDRCVFCGGDDMTEEHLVADWVLRAFHRSRHPPTHFSGSLRGSNQLEMSFDPPTATARVLCRDCNNTWVSRIDASAAQAIRPMIQGHGTVELDEHAQSALASWVFKTTLIFDVVSNGGVDGPLGYLRGAFREDGLAPPGTTIYVGPAPRIPFTLEAVPEVGQLVMFGVRPTQGSVNVTGNIMSPDGTLLRTTKSALPTPGWTVMLGRINAIISGRRAPIIPTADWRYGCVWPTSKAPVRLTSHPVDAPTHEDG